MYVLLKTWIDVTNKPMVYKWDLALVNKEYQMKVFVVLENQKILRVTKQEHSLRLVHIAFH